MNKAITRSLLLVVVGAMLVSFTSCATLQPTAAPEPATPAASSAAAAATPTLPIATQAKAFMDDYARDLTTGNKESIIARYHPQGVFILAEGLDDLMKPRQLGEFYRTQWQKPYAMEWKGLRFRTLSSETILIDGGFTSQPAAGKPAQYFSYIAVLIRENGKLRIRSEIEFPETPEK